LGWLLEEIHVTWAQLEKKQTRPRLYTNYHEENQTVAADGVANHKRRRQDYSSDDVKDFQIVYGGNKESKKVQRTLLKQQYENFAALSSDTIDQTFDRLQKLISQLEIHGEVINQEDMNLNLLRSLPSEWKTHALIWKNKVEIETISLDDFTNNTNNTNKADDTAHGVSTTHTTTHTKGNGVNFICLDNLYDDVICAFLVSQPNSPQLSQEDLEQLHPDDLEEMDLQ
ncbi:hypothetical protein Tco_1433815, partial [Tanacetum coccineum]